MAKNTAQQIKKTGFCLAGLKVNEDKAKEGILVPFMGEASFRISRGGSNAYQRFIANAYKENQSKVDSGSEEGEEIAEAATREATARFELIGWEGVVDEEGNEVPYSVDTAIEYLAIDEVYDFVKREANKNENWRIMKTEELSKELKNS